MRWAWRDSFRTQIALIALASLSMAAIAVILVWEVLRTTEQTLVREAQQQCVGAARELGQQYLQRASLRDDPEAPRELEPALPFEAEDFSLRGLSSAVLRSYEGVSGGFFLGSRQRIAGYVDLSGTADFDDPGPLARQLIQGLVAREPEAQEIRVDQLVQGQDVLVGAVLPLEGSGSFAWSVKRLAGVRDPVVQQRRWWLAGWVFSAFLGLGGLISISIRLRRGVDAVSRGLQHLESDFSYRLPNIGGDLGEIAQAVNQMAGRRQVLEATLRQQDRLAALGKVVAGVAHEIRNPLNSMRLTLELLGRRVQRGAVKGDEVEGALHEVDRLDRILERSLAFGRPRLEDRRVQDVRPLIDRAAKMVQEQSLRKKVPVVVEAGEELLAADVDGLEVEQVLLNLLLNAIEASPEGGDVRVQAAREEETIRIAVSDRGAGIPDLIREHIFDPYFTTKETGSGLGLSVSREVILHHDGDLTFESNGRETTFLLRLPESRKRAKASLKVSP